MLVQMLLGEAYPTKDILDDAEEGWIIVT